MVPHTKGTSITMTFMATVSTSGQMTDNSRVTGKIIRCMERAGLPGTMAGITKVITLMTRNMVREPSLG